MLFERNSSTFLFAAFLLVGPTFYCAGVFLALLFPAFDWHIIRYLPIPEFQHRTHILVPRENGLANRYALICLALTLAFFVQLIVAIKFCSAKLNNSLLEKSCYLMLADGIKFILACLGVVAFSYVTFFSPQLIIESNSRVGVIYNATDLKFFVYWGVANYISLIVGFFISRCLLIAGAVFRRIASDWLKNLLR
jgi:hypothetical protein